jgi:inorganic pyrophosphatase
MRIDAIKIGNNPPEDVNVIIEVPIGGEPINMSWTRPPELWSSIAFFTRPCVTQATTVSCRTRYRKTAIQSMCWSPTRGRSCLVRLSTSDRSACLRMEDESGGDEKIIAVPVSRVTKRYAHIANYTDLPEITLQQIQHFFEHYKNLESGKWVKVVKWGGATEAKTMIMEAIERARA